MVILTLLSFKSNRVSVHYEAGGILSRSVLKGLAIRYMATLPVSNAKAGCCWAVAAGGEAWLGPWGAPGARRNT